jgi:hypothetical protein
MRFTNTIIVQRPIGEVFSYLARFENIPQWNYAISDTRRLTPGPVGVGSTYVQQRTVPSVSEESFEVTTYLPDRALAIKGRFGRFPTEATYVVEPAGDATRLTNIMEVQQVGLIGVLASLASARLRAAVGDNLQRLKGILEGSERPVNDGATTRSRRVRRTR